MSEAEQTTLHLILSAAMQEFLKKGFKSASLRNIVKTAGVTTGAFYGYYDSKEDLFEDKIFFRGVDINSLEYQANEFAGELLMPEELMRFHFGEGIIFKSRIFPIKSTLLPINSYPFYIKKESLPINERNFTIKCFDLDEYRFRNSNNYEDQAEL